MADTHGQRLLDLVAGAMGVDPVERDEWLRNACEGDKALLEGAAALLTQSENADRLFGEPLAAESTRGEEPRSPHGVAHGEPLTRGTRLGDYEIEQRIGAGGMGVVYRAQQLSLNRTVALKVLPQHLRASTRGLERFRREVEAAARLHHPNIVTVFASGDDGATAYYAMEFVDGPSFSQVIDSLRRDPVPEVCDGASASDSFTSGDGPSLPSSDRGRLGMPVSEDGMPSSDEDYFQRVARLLAGVADGLDYAHRNRVIHRDIKPSNLWFSADGRLRIGDFGLARVTSEPGMTQTGEVVGTPYYMAPEQLSARPEGIDARTDIYALGATLYEALTLRPPFPGESREVVLARIASEEPSPPRRLNRRTPIDLETVCLKALAKRPAERYATASEMASDLRRFADRIPVTARRSSLVHRGFRWCARHPPLAGAVLASIVLAAVAATLAIRAQHLATTQLEATSRAAQAATDLREAEAQIAAANETEQERLFQKAMLAGMQGDADAVSAALAEAEAIGASEARLGLVRGQVHLTQGAFDAAIAEFESAAEQLPDRVAPRALLAESHARAGLYTTAAALRAEATSMAARSVEDLVLLGRMELRFAPRSALASLDEAIRRDRQNIVARLIRGSARAQVAYDETDPNEAESALEDLRLAESLLDETPYLLSQFVNAHLIASAGHASRGDQAAAAGHLTDAESFARGLGRYPGDYEAHRWRAYYFERTGDLDSAIEEWRAIDDKTIGYLIMCLYRAGRFDEALAACDEYRAHSSTGTADFCHSFVLAAIAEDPETLVADFHFDQQLRWDPGAAWFSMHTLWSLAGQPFRATTAIESDDQPEDVTESMRRMRSYLVGEITSTEYLQQTKDDKRNVAQAHLVIGVGRLGRGERALARQSFDAVVSQRLDYAFSTAVARALQAQLDHDGEWPAWIDNSALGQ